MTTRSEREKALERATSDYLSVSKSSHLFDEGEYARAEADAWERLLAAREALEAEETVGV